MSKIYLFELEKIVPQTPEIKSLQENISKPEADLAKKKKELEEEIKKARSKCKHQMQPVYGQIFFCELETGSGCPNCGYAELRELTEEDLEKM